jgi:hypothetical protein
MLFQFEVTRFPYNNNSPSSSRGRRIYYATPLPECEQLNFFFRRRRRRGTPSVLAASAREIRFKKALDFGWRGALFPIFLLLSSYSVDSISYFDTFTSTTGAHRGSSSGGNDTTSSSCGSARVNERLEERLSGKRKSQSFPKRVRAARIFVDKDLDI